MSIPKEQAIRVAEKIVNSAGINTVETGKDNYLGPDFCQAVVERASAEGDYNIKIMKFRRASGVLVDSVSYPISGKTLEAEVSCESGNNGKPVIDDKVYQIQGRGNGFFTVSSGQGSNRQPHVIVDDGTMRIGCVANYVNNVY